MRHIASRSTAVVETRPYCLALAMATCVAVAPSFAQQSPRDPVGLSDTLREDQQRRQPPAQDFKPAETTIKPAVKPVTGLMVDVRGFRFSGLTVMPQERLQGVVQKFLGAGKTFDDLQAAADAASEYLQQRGYFVAQVYLPEQPIADGIIELAVLEGRLAQVRVDMEGDVPVARHIVEGLLSPLAPGTVMHRDVVERALFLVSDLRALRVRSIVEPGPTPGTSILVVKVTPGRRIDGLIEFDNHSSRFTGDYRLGAGVNINSPFRRGDLLSARGLIGVPGGGADLDFGRISYLTPVGIYGTKIGLAYLRLNYHLGTSLFDPVDQKGRAEVASVFGLHPIVRTRNFNLFAQASFDLREFEDDRRAVNVKSERKTKVGGLGLVGDTRDAYLGGGINNFSLGYTAGHLDIQTPADLAADQSTLGGRTAGHYSRLNGSATRLNSLTQNIGLFVSYSFQLASKNLDASEKVGLGGPTAVRAYGVGEATSDEAQLFTAEIRGGLPKLDFIPGTIVASGFFDFAQGKLNKDPQPLQAATNTRTLRGLGVGLTWGRQDDFLVRVMAAWRLSGPAISDPVDRHPRLFFTLQKFL